VDSKKDSGIETMIKRGLDLHRSGAVSVHGDPYVVRGTSRAYTVFLRDDESRCDCPDYQERG
jgi:hypothetical protein